MVDVYKIDYDKSEIRWYIINHCFSYNWAESGYEKLI